MTRYQLSSGLSLIEQAPQFELSHLLPEKSLPAEFKNNSVLRWFHMIPRQSLYLDGGKIDFDDECLLSILEVFSRYETPLSIDYDHQSMSAADKTGPIEKAGIIIGLGIAEDGLWALGRFSEHAIKLNKNGSYMFCSPVIDFGANDRKTGAKVKSALYNVALTDNPALDGQAPIMLTTMESKMPDTTEDKQAKLAEGEPDAAPEKEPEKSSIDKTIQSLIADVGCKDAEELASLIEGKKGELVQLLKGDATVSMSKDANVILLSRVNSLEGEIKVLRDERDARAAKDTADKLDKRITVLLSEGRVTPETEATARKMFARDEALAEEFFSKQIVPIKSQAGEDGTKQDSTQGGANQDQVAMREQFMRALPGHDGKYYQDLVDRTIRSIK